VLKGVKEIKLEPDTLSPRKERTWKLIRPMGTPTDFATDYNNDLNLLKGGKGGHKKPGTNVEGTRHSAEGWRPK